MRRAIVWLCWGESFIRQAIESARTAAAVTVADRILITDADGAAHAKDRPEFTGIVAAKLVHRNNREKSRLIDLVPEGYETFLYLDTDTHLIGDVTLGFEKAERHGIAMVPAPNYNLPEYFGFGSTMAELGIRPADQMVYNAGVIFFHLTPAVRRVLERWRDLCATFGAKLSFPTDQPFLTLALEQFDLAPYVLSPLYNYRGLGEYAVGRVRIWHSHFPPPADLNTFELAWPARRFKQGARVADAEAAMTMLPPPLPQSMLRLMLPESRTRWPLEAMQSVIAQALAIYEVQGSRVANEFLLDEIRIGASEARNESYFTEALHYFVGLLHAHAGEPEKMAHHLGLSHTMPGGDDDQLFSDHVNQSRVLRAAQLQAIARGLPPILIACMPRSASATLTHTLARAIYAPVLHLGAGPFPARFLVPSWLDMFLEGGGITQDHFGPSAFNIGVLRARAPRDLFVLIRDPRAAARSQVHYLAGGRRDVAEPLEPRIERECIANFIPWLQGWIDCMKAPGTGLRIHWLYYQDVQRDPAGVLREISGILQADYLAMAEFAIRQTVSEVTIHFVSGNDRAWEAEVGDATRGRLWDACTSEIKSLLDLQP